MKALKTDSARIAVAALVVVACAIAFWLLLLSPKREKVDELTAQTDQLTAEVATEQQRAALAAEAKENFPANYQQLVLLGKAVPAEAATPSLLVQLDGVGIRSNTRFMSISGGGGGGGSSGGSTAEATESAAALLPLGASVGPAGLSVMPYSLDFDGGFFAIADFIEGLDALVRTRNGEVDARGRLVTIDGFNLSPGGAEGGASAAPSSVLSANFSVTTYVTPPGQGLTAGATPSGPGTELETEATELP